jgi:hypothetical protein
MNIITGGDAPLYTQGLIPEGTQPQTPPANGEMPLAEGDIVDAEVTEAKPDGKIGLKTPDGQRFLAELMSERTLVPGQKVTLAVMEMRGETPMVEITRQGASSAEAFLKAMKAPVSEQNLALAREALAQQAPFTPKQFAVLSKNFAVFEEAANHQSAPQKSMAQAPRRAEQAVFMARHNIPINRETAAQYNSVNQPQARLGALLQKILDILPPESVQHTSRAPQTEQPRTQPAGFIQQQPQAQPQTVQQTQPAPQTPQTPQTLQQPQPAPAQHQPAQPPVQAEQPIPTQPQTAQQSQPAPQPPQTPQTLQQPQPAPAQHQPAQPPVQAEQLISAQPQTQTQQPITTQPQVQQPGQPSPPPQTQPQTAQQSQPVPQQSQTPQTVQQPQLAPAQHQPAQPQAQTQQPITTQPQVQQHQPTQTHQPVHELLDAIFQKISPERSRELPLKLDIPKQTREIGRLITTVLQRAESLPEQARTELVNTARDIVQTLRFSEQISHCASFAQLPLSINGERTTAQLYVFNDSEGGKKIDPRNATLFLSLSTSSLGTVEGFVKVIGKGVEADFSLQSEDIARRFRAGMPELEKLLEARGYRLERVNASVAASEVPLPPAAVEKGRDERVRRYKFNRTV